MHTPQREASPGISNAESRPFRLVFSSMARPPPSGLSSSLTRQSNQWSELKYKYRFNDLTGDPISDQIVFDL